LNSGALLAELTARATYLLPVLVTGLLIGEPWAKLLRFPQWRTWMSDNIATLNAKLNRPQRSTATRLYRGMVALAMLLVPALVTGLLLMRPVEWIQLLETLLLIALFGEAVRPHSLWRQHREATRKRLTLQSVRPAYLFADTHALLRYRIVEMGERFATGIVGSSFYFLLADMPGLLLYLGLAAAARCYSPAIEGNRAFGWAAASLFRIANLPPRILACFLLWVAAWFTPLTRPLSTLRHAATAAHCFYGWLAYLLNLSLGGLIPTPAGEVALRWYGDGNPKALAADESRALQLVAVAILLWICLLGSIIFI
jgi:cobalamin biosynthesis protein CobD/CbiB